MTNILVITLLFIITMFACNIPLPMSSPGPSPTPEPSPISSPSPIPSPSPLHVCQLPPLPDHGDCPRENKSNFLPNVERAIDFVIKNHPELFDLNDDPVGGQPRIVMFEQYYFAVISALEDQGVCAKVDDRFEEIGVKDSNEYNEQFDISRGSEPYVRRGMGSYRSTCYPSAF